MKLRYKILAATFVISLLMLVTMGYIAYHYVQKEVKENIDRDLTNTASLISLRMEEAMASIATDLQMLSASPIFNDYLQYRYYNLSEEAGVAKNQIKALFENLLTMRSDYAGIQYQSVARETIVAINNNELQDHLSGGLNTGFEDVELDSPLLQKIKTVVKISVRSDLNFSIMRFEVPVNRGVYGQGFLLIDVSPKQIFSVLREIYAKHGYVVNVFNGGSSLFNSPESVDGSGDNDENYIISSKIKISTSPFEINLKYPKKEAYSIIDKIKSLWLALILLFVILSWAVYVYYSKIISKPFEILVKDITNFDVSKGEKYLGDQLTNKFKTGGHEVERISSAIKILLDRISSYQDELAKNTNLIAIGRSTAMVAHDVRRPLSSMKALLGSLPHIKDDPVQVRKMVASVDKSITQTNALLNDIMEFSRDTIVLELKDTDPQSIIVSAVGDAMRNYPKNLANIEYDLRHKKAIYADGTRLARVLTNIIDNALGAMRLEGGMVYEEILIKTESVPGGLGAGGAGSENQDPETRKPSNPMLRITIADSGPGIPDEIIGKIFEPFFTHGKKGGTGLGLAICQKIIEKHGGRIEVRNRGVIASERSERSNLLNAGSTGDCHAPSGLAMTGAEFIIEIPEGKGAAFINKSELIYNAQELDVFRQEEEVREEYGDTANKQAFMEINKERGRKSTLLLIDDEPLFRETIRSLLNGIKDVHEHVKVVEVDSAEVGLKIFESLEGRGKGDSPHTEGGQSPFDYVIADIDLGRRQMNGYEFTRRILQKYPQTHALIHSNKRKGEMDEEIRVIARSPVSDGTTKQSPAINCMKGIATTAEGGLAMTPSHFMGFLPKPMTSSELLQFLACKSFETVACHPCESGDLECVNVIPASAGMTEVVGRPALAGATSPTKVGHPKKTVLLVNDDEAFSFNLKCDLKAQGLQVLTATNVSDALQHLTEQKFDAIFSDINLEHPTDNGYEFLAEVRKKDNNLPFIFMSGYDRTSEWPKAQKAGATDYLQLPFEMEELMEKLGA